MKTIIYYFTGTGNSLAAAKKIAASPGDCDIVPEADPVGIVCPVEAIPLHMMRGAEGRGRYRHSDLAVADMEARRRWKDTLPPEPRA